MNRKFYRKQWGQTKVMAVPNGRRRLWLGMAALMFCFCLFGSDAWALFTIVESGSSYVVGIGEGGDLSVDGNDFGMVMAIADDHDAYSLYSDDGDITIVGLFGSSGSISAFAGEEHAYGLYSPNGSIITDALNGTIVAETDYWRAVGLFTEDGDIDTGNIGGTITAVAGGSSAFGLRSDYEGSIYTGDISGTITAVAGGDRAYGFRSDGLIWTGDISGTITATAAYDRASGLSAYDSLTTGDINGTITAIAGVDYAYGLYSHEYDVNIGDIDGTITAIAGEDYACGLYSYDDDVSTGAINGTITANAGHDYAYGLFAYEGLTTGDINGTISAITGEDYAYGLYSDDDYIETGAINGTITANAGDSYAYGLNAYEVTTGDIYGTISADVNGSNAYALYAYDIEIYGEIDGEISAEAGDSNAYALYAYDDIEIGEIDGEISANAGDSNAYALYANDEIYIDDDIDSNALITATAGTNNAAGLYSLNGSIDIGAIDGTIIADANGSNAYALYANEIKFYGDIDGEISAEAGDSNAYAMYANSALEVSYIDSNTLITATAGQDNAYGLYSDSNSITTGDIDGTITAMAEDGDAYGLYSGGGTSIHTGDINGIITADVNNGSNAYALYSNDDITTGDIGIDANISGTASGNQAYGLYSVNGSITTGDVNGTITATAGNRRAYGLRSYGSLTTGDINGVITATATDQRASGLYSDNNSITTGAITGTITAAVGTSHAYGLRSQGSITTGDVNGTIDVNAASGEFAFGLRSFGSLTTGAIDGTITANAGNARAAGLRSDGSITTSNIGGTIISTAGNSNAYGMRSDDELVTGAITGTINATAGDWRAFGLYSDTNSVTTGAITGTITATAENSDAYGLYSGGGSSIHIGDINGTITADVNNGSDAYAIYAVNDITVGNIYSDANITATAGTNNAYALWSGDSIYTEEINGTITATAGTNWAVGLYTGDGNSIYTGGINGTIIADANTSDAYGLYANGDIDIDGDIGSDALISATAGESGACGLLSDGNSIDIDGDMNGSITTIAGVGHTIGLYAHVDVNTGNINGDITATATTGSDAYGLFSNTGSIYTGAIDGNITTTAGGDNASGLYSYGGSIYTDDINGNITATAGHEYAYGLYSFGSITTGAIDGNIIATAGDYRAAGLYTENGSITTGDIDGKITATVIGTADMSAFGLRSGGVLTTGAINGTITAEETIGSYAYAMYAGSDINIVGDIGSDANITATAGISNAYGLYSENGSITTGAIDGNITATAGTNNAYALLSSGSISTGDIDGQIYAETTNGSYAYGLYSYNNDVNTGAINGKITADANTSDAYAIVSNGVLTVDGNIGSSAVISATAGTSWAVGLYSHNNSLETGDINGVITATAGTIQAFGMRSSESLTTGDIGSGAMISATAGTSYAYGLYSDMNSITTGDINGIISATAGQNTAYALVSELDLTTGAIDGSITATAGSSYAYGLYSQSGDVNTGDIDGSITATASNTAVGMYSHGSLTTGAIGGTIDVNASGDSAYGILSYGPMDVTVDGGTVSAVSNGGTYVAAIQSGKIGGTGLDIQDANDTLEVVAGSAIIGDIDLAMDGTDDDLLTLSGLDTDSTIFDDDLMNIETININGGHWYINGTVSDSANGITMDGGILGGTGTLGSLNILDGIFAPGASIGTETVNGDLTLGPNSVFLVDVNNSDSADLVIVTGDANLAGGTIRGNHLEGIDHSFYATVIDANTGLIGQFATIEGGTAFLSYFVDYNTVDFNVILDVNVIPDLAFHSLTGNQSALGNLFNDLEGSGGDMDDVIDEIRDLPDGDAVNDAYNQIMPQDKLGLQDITRKNMNLYNDSVMDRMDNVRKTRQYAMSRTSRYLLASTDNSAALPSRNDDWMPFVKGIGIWGDRDKGHDIAGYRYSIFGTVAGMDKLVSDEMLLGFSAAMSRANVNYTQQNTGTNIDSVFCSLYGSYFKNDWFFDWNAAYGHTWYDSERGIHFGAIDRKAESDHEGDVYSAAIEFGKNLGDSSLILEPVAGVGYTYVHEESYTEKGADALNLDVDSDTTDGFYSKLGFRLAKEFHFGPDDTVIVPRASIFWIHDFVEREDVGSTFVDGGSFSTDGLEPVRDIFDVGGGFNIYLDDYTKVFFDYSWHASGKFNSHAVELGLQWSF